jgi:putative acetyltransferase
MIRKFQEFDIEEVLDIWLKASIIAHDFIDSSYWVSELNNMRQTYIPDSETYVYENQHGR